MEARALLNGSPDATFGLADLPGRTTFGLAGLVEVAGVATQADGGVLVAATVSRAGNDDFAVIRLRADGEVDPGFGASGMATIAFDLGQGDNVDDVPRALAVQPDGRILVVGQVESAAGSLDFGVARLEADGRLDATFGAGGRVVVGFDRGPMVTQQDDSARAVAIQTDGRILVAGPVDDLGDENDFGLLRLRPDGSPDPEFGIGGLAVVEFDLGPTAADRDDDAAALALQADGRILVAGAVSSAARHKDFGVARLRPDGSPDPEFGALGDGRVVVGIDLGSMPTIQDDRPSAIAVQADGRIVVAGTADAPGARADFAVLRLLPGGEPDPSFDGDGRFNVHVGSGPMDLVSGLAIQPDGLILVAGVAQDTGGGADFAAIRLSPLGALDDRFGDAGRVVLPFNLGPRPFDDDLARGAVLDPSGRLVIAGRVEDALGVSLVGVARIHTDSTPPSVLRVGPVDPGVRNGPLDAVEVRLSEPVDPASLAASLSLSRDGAAVGLSGTLVVSTVPGTPSTYRVSGLAAVTDVEGSYRLAVDGRPLRDAAGNAGVGSADAAFVVDLTPPALLQLDGPGPGPLAAPVASVALRFSEAVVGPAASAVRLTRGGVALMPAPGLAIEPTHGSPGDYRVVGLAEMTGDDGDYTLTVDASALADLAGNPGSGVRSVAFSVDRTPPAVVLLGPVVPDPRRIPLDAVEVRLSEPVTTPTAFRLLRDGVAVPPSAGVRFEAEPGTPGGFRLVGLAAMTADDGDYELTVDATTVADLAGNVGVGARSLSFRVDRTPPAVLRLGPVVPDPRNRPLDAIEVEFSEPIDLSASPAVAFTLTRGGVSVPIGDGARLVAVPGTSATYRLDGLAAVTSARGVYRIEVDAAMARDLAGNAGIGRQSAGFTVRRRAVPADYDGDGTSDLATYTVVDGVGRFDIRRSVDGDDRVVLLGGPGDFPVDGDYDGDGIIDPAVFGFDPALGHARFLIERSGDGTRRAIAFGGPFDFPIGGDYDGDGVTDLAVFGFSPLNGFSRYAIVHSSGSDSLTLPFGGRQDFPVAGDFDGDGRSDPAVYGFSPLNGFARFGVVSSSGRPTLTLPFGGLDDRPASGDFDGDGLSDVAVFGYSPLDGFARFGVVFSDGRPTLTLPFGGADDLPSGGDYDGDEATDLAVFGFSPLNGFARFGILPSGGSPTRTEPFGSAASIGLPPFPGRFRIQDDPGAPALVASAPMRASASFSADPRRADPAAFVASPSRRLIPRLALTAPDPVPSSQSPTPARLRPRPPRFRPD